MTYLSLDVGARRTGVAVSDPSATLARPLTTLPGGLSPGDLAARLLPLIRELEVAGIVIGLPRRLSGAHGPEAEAMAGLAAELGRRLEVPVHLWDERLSTVEVVERLAEAGVRRRKRSRDQIDRLAATVILQGWLDHRKSAAAQP